MYLCVLGAFMKMDYIGEYVCLAHELSYSKASSTLYISQSALSRHIDLIEEEFGTELFLRTTRKVELTKAGEEVLEVFSDIWDRYKRLKISLLCQTENPDVELAICTSDALLTSFLGPILNRLRSHCPNVRLRYSSRQPGEAYAELLRGNVDVAVAYEFNSSANYLNDDTVVVSLPNCIDPCCIILNPKSRLSKKETIVRTDLSNLTLVLAEDSRASSLEFNSCFNDFIIDALKADGVTLKRIKKVQSPSLLGGLLDEGMYALFPYSIAVSLKQSGLNVRTVGMREFDIPLALYYNLNNRNPAIFSLLEEVKGG